jgi:alkylation response protein AidB-like acyl-CoA dehydrogenase
VSSPLPKVDLDSTSALVAFRTEIRIFRTERAPDRTLGHADPDDLTGLDLDCERAHQHRAGELGYLGISLPTELGGGGRPPSWKAVWAFEAAYHDAPSIDTAVTLCAGPLSAFGTDAQQRMHLPPMVRGEVQWAIAYTEPGAGSDLTLVETTARVVDDGYVLTGHKASPVAQGRLVHDRAPIEARRGAASACSSWICAAAERRRRRTANPGRSARRVP